MTEPKLKFTFLQFTDYDYQNKTNEVISGYNVLFKRGFKITFDAERTKGFFQVGIGVGFDNGIEPLVVANLLTILEFTTIDGQKIQSKPDISEFVKVIQMATAHLRSVVYFDSYTKGNGNLIIPIESDETIYDAVRVELSKKLN